MFLLEVVSDHMPAGLPWDYMQWLHPVLLWSWYGRASWHHGCRGITEKWLHAK